MYKMLRACPLFRGMTEIEIESALATLQLQIRQYAKGDIVALQGSEYATLLIMLSGCVKGEMVDFSGKVVKIEDIAAPRPIAPAFLFGENNKLPVNITATESCEVLAIPKFTFIRLMQQHEVILNNYLNIISNRAHFLSQRIHFLSLKSLHEKVVNYLLELSHPDKTEITLQSSQQEIADYFGVARPSLARVFSELENEKLINLNNRTVTIVDRKKLMSKA